MSWCSATTTPVAGSSRTIAPWSTTTVTVDRLERNEYAERQAVKEDRRVHLIALTEKGKRAFAEHHQYHSDLTEQILAVLSPEESEQLLAILRKINVEAF